MSKTFRYTRIDSRCYDCYKDRYEEDGVDFDYEVENSELLPVLVDLMFDDYFGEDSVVCENEELKKSVKEKLSKLIDEQDMTSMLADNYEDSLKEIFRDDAMDWFNS